MVRGGEAGSLDSFCRVPEVVQAPGKKRVQAGELGGDPQERRAGRAGRATLKMLCGKGQVGAPALPRAWGQPASDESVQGGAVVGAGLGPWRTAQSPVPPRSLEPPLTGDAQLCFWGPETRAALSRGTCACFWLSVGGSHQSTGSSRYPWPHCCPKRTGPPPAAADLQVGDVPVDVHGGRHAVLGDIFVVAGAWLTVHGIDAGNGDPLVAASNVPATGKGVSPLLQLGQGTHGPPPSPGVGPAL